MDPSIILNNLCKDERQILCPSVLIYTKSAVNPTS